ncbi:hypothetical protein H6CHR_04967 [Variovorax sp. PBL-H6]|nr:hypothetical protein H6CHR_04967 [Variovorax sp. PBL-H6]
MNRPLHPCELALLHPEPEAVLLQSLPLGAEHR